MDFKVGDIVARKSYGGDVYFRIADVIKNNGENIYFLKGLLHRLTADSVADDLVRYDARKVYDNIEKAFSESERLLRASRDKERVQIKRFRSRPGKILHIDGDRDFMERCIEKYRAAGISSVGKVIAESKQPSYIRNLLMQYRPNILVITGHDSLKKGADSKSLKSYDNSKYFIQSVEKARSYEPGADKLCIFAGACQSYFEYIMDAGANFASSPARILINALDPALVAEKIALTDRRSMVTPQEVAAITISGSDGIGGITTRGQLIF